MELLRVVIHYWGVLEVERVEGGDFGGKVLQTRD